MPLIGPGEALYEPNTQQPDCQLLAYFYSAPLAWFYSALDARLTREHDLDQQAAENVLHYLADQELATHEVPDDRTIVIERVRDELGDWRVCVLTHLGSRVHAPWAMAAAARIKAAGLDVETMWSEDGFVLRFPEADAPPDTDFLLMAPARASELIMQQLGSTALFAAKFREAEHPARSSFRVAEPTAERRSGSSASEPPICSALPCATPASPCSSRPIASAFATSSTCPR